MSTCSLIISPAARDDLRNIYQYGLHNWGQQQSSRYLGKLKDFFRLLPRQPHSGIERPEIFPEIRSFVAESHIIYYRPQSDGVEIARILHTRQDPCRHTIEA